MSRIKVSKKPDEPQKKSFLLPLLLVAGGLLLLVGGYAMLTRDRVDPNFVPEVSGAPRLQVDKDRVDLGDVAFNDNAWAGFEVTNVGDQPLVFTRAPYVELIEGC